MIKLKLVCAGKLKEKFYIDACAEYIKRLGAYCKPEICELPEVTGRADGLEREAERILAQISDGEAVCAMCVEGGQMSSEQLADWINTRTNAGQSSITFIIGSSDGLHETVKSRAALRLSMSEMTFPHHLARVMLLEQLYRAMNISAGGKYHK